MQISNLNIKQEDYISVDKGGIIKLITPFNILNQNLHKMDLIRAEMKNRILSTERLHDDYRKMYKNHLFT